MSLYVKDPGTFYHYMTTVVMEKDNAKGDLARGSGAGGIFVPFAESERD